MITDLDGSAASLVSDICIVGAGPAGLAMASVFDRHGIDAIVLDAGAEQPADDPGAELSPDAMPYPDVATTRRRGFGGTAALWGTDGDGWTNGAALFRPLEPLDFDQRPWVEHSGWPIGFDDLNPFYQQVCRLGRLSTNTYNPEHWDPDRTKRLPLADTGFQTAVFHLSHRGVYTQELG